MQFTNHRNRLWTVTASAICTLTLSAATFFPALTSGARQTEARPDEESLSSLPEPVHLVWDTLAPESLSESYAGSTVALRLENLTAEAQQVALRFVADDGGLNTAARKRAVFTLPPHATVTQPVDVDEFGFDAAQVKYSGKLQAVVRATPADQTDGKGRYRQLEAPPLYFHPASTDGTRRFAFYGERALRGKFAAGNFRARSTLATLDAPGEVTTRVTYGGAGQPASTPERETSEIVEPDLESAPRNVFSFDQPTLTPTVALMAANNYTTCIKFEIRTVDSDVAIPNGANAGGTEDHYLGANEDISVKARGVRVKLSRAGWEQTYNANNEGCFNWSHDSTSGFTLRVYGYATDDNGNYVRIHDSPSSFASYPGATYSAVLNNVAPTPNGTNTYEVGDHQSKWTAMAALAFGLYRYHDGLSDKAFHVGIDDTQSGGSSAHFGDSNDAITSGRHYLRLGNGGADPQTRYKFIVAHELGHAIAALYYGNHDDAVNGGEPNVSLSHNVDPNACGVSGTTYSISSKEWNSVGFREGFAHFIAARIWNDKDTEGAFTWFAGPHDLERFDQGANNAPGGRLENICCVGGGCADSWDSAGTNEDWLRFFWDWYTFESNTCTTSPSRLDMLKLYRQTRLNGGLTSTNYFDKMRAAAQDINLEGCAATSYFDYYAEHNGIDNE
jgi:hypothetical protein